MREKNNTHKKKMIAPIIIGIFIVAYYAIFTVVFAAIPDISIWVKLLFAVVPLGLIAVAIYVVIERIKEIRSGEEDDLSKY